MITFVTTHNPNNVNMFIFLQINKDILNNSTAVKTSLKHNFCEQQKTESNLKIYSCESVFSKFSIT